MLNRPAQYGVTLTELLIGIVILAIVLAAGAPTLGHWIKNSEIRTAAESMHSGFLLARVEAVKRNVKTEFSLTDLPRANWTVGCVSVKADCPEAIQAYSSQEGSSRARVEAAQTRFTFNGLGKLEPLPASDVNIEVTYPGVSCMADQGPIRCLRIAITKSGQIRMCDPSRGRDDPKGC